MPDSGTKRNRNLLFLLIAASVIAALVFTTAGSDVRHRFFASLRIAKPQSVSASVPSSPGPRANRQLQDLIAGMMSPKVNTILDEPDQTVARADSAARLAGFAMQLPRTRTDLPAFTVFGARTLQLSLERSQLNTIFAQAGIHNAALPGSLDGGAVTLRAPRAIRVQYGNCPTPAPNTVQGQLQGPPPPSADNSSCIVVTESPAVSAEVPAGLDAAQLAGIALELSGLSPVQSRDFQQTFDWKSELVLPVPRGIRTFEPKEINGAKGILLMAAGRRGPAYTMIWMKDGIVFSLAGYGNSADAVPLAQSVR
jgi:hypothetical protein